MNIRDMTIDQLKEGIIRCKDRLAWNNYGLMKTKERVIAAKKEYEHELENRGVKQLDF